MLENMDRIRSARLFVEFVARVKPEEEVLVLVDVKTAKIGELLTTIARASGAKPILTIYGGEDAHGTEPLNTIASAMKSANVCLTTIRGLDHTVAVDKAKAAGMRLASFRDTEEQGRGGTFNLTFNDMNEIRERNRKLQDAMKDADKVRITSEKGSDVLFSIKSRTPISLGPFLGRDWTDIDRNQYPKIPCWMGYSEVAIAPVTGTGEGTYVVDGQMEGIGLVDEPITWTIKKGKAVEIKGGKSAQILKEIVEGADENARNLGEFAIGTNHKIKMQVGDNMDKCQYGTAHIALGHNKAELKGEVFSKIHMDGISLNPTITIDDKIILKNGELRL